MGDIATRAERGDDARTLILALNDALMPAMSDEQADAFVRLLAINTPEAHLAAARMLVPDCVTYCNVEECARGKPGQHCRTEVSWESDGIEDRYTGIGPTPAHALIAAIARSMGHGD